MTRPGLGGRAGGSGERDPHAAVLLALLLDVGDERPAPISPVRRTWVPPQGCRSMPSISTRRTRPEPRGGFTDMVFTRPGLASSSSSVIQRSVTAASRATSAFSLAAISALSRPASGMSKSSRPSPSPMAPPVTG